jgi:hypothetical protein
LLVPRLRRRLLCSCRRALQLLCWRRCMCRGSDSDSECEWGQKVVCLSSWAHATTNAARGARAMHARRAAPALVLHPLSCTHARTSWCRQRPLWAQTCRTAGRSAQGGRRAPAWGSACVPRTP